MDEKMTAAAPGAPTNCAELNGWIRRHFQCFEGPPKAYFELPMLDHQGRMLRAPEGVRPLDWWRGVYVTVGFIGPEAWCCEQFMARLSSLVPVIDLEDASTPLIVRRWAEYSPPVWADQWWFDLPTKDFPQGLPKPQDPENIPPRWKLLPSRVTMRFTFWDETLNKLPLWDETTGKFIDHLTQVAP